MLVVLEHTNQLCASYAAAVASDVYDQDCTRSRTFERAPQNEVCRGEVVAYEESTESEVIINGIKGSGYVGERSKLRDRAREGKVRLSLQTTS